MKNNSCMIKGGTNMNRQDFYDGKLFDAYRYMGAHKDGDKIRFVTYAPRASRISIIGILGFIISFILFNGFLVKRTACHNLIKDYEKEVTKK